MVAGARGQERDRVGSPSVMLVGLTGGMGSGKSTVSAGLAAHGAVIIDADAITRELQEAGRPVFDAIVERFGPGIVGPDGELDRAALADVVFADADERAALEAIVHPAVGEEIGRRILGAGADAVVVLDVPLLVEKGRDDLAGLVVVDVDPEVAVDRLVRFRGVREGDARARLATQASREERLARADFVIDNSGDVDELAKQVDACWAWLRDRAGG
jgi:dephospho-CoA kinase